MKLYNVNNIDLLERIVRTVSGDLYSGNVVFKDAPIVVSRNCITFGLTVTDSNKPGSRRSNTGRRIAAACWHAHRDVMIALFAACPDARLQSMLADYRGAVEFNAMFPRTGGFNLGSDAVPVRADHACNCDRDTGSRELSDTLRDIGVGIPSAQWGTS